MMLGVSSCYHGARTPRSSSITGGPSLGEGEGLVAAVGTLLGAVARAGGSTSGVGARCAPEALARCGLQLKDGGGGASAEAGAAGGGHGW